MKEMAQSPFRGVPLRQKLSAVLLVGGIGTRLRPILPSKPKPLAPIGEVPFLELLILQLRSQGIRRLVLCTGFQTQQIEEAFGDGHKWNVAIEYSIESHPLGTAGALKNAEKFLSEDSDFLVMNGDSFLETDFHQLIRFHRERGGWATIAVRRVEDAARYGTVEVDGQNRVVRFSEKLGVQSPGLVNGGIYVFKREVLQSLQEGPASLEMDVLPKLIQHGTFAIGQAGMFIDIGTPEDYTRAQALHQRLSKAAMSTPRFGPLEDVRR